MPVKKQTDIKPPQNQSGINLQKSYLDNLTNLMDKYNRAANDKPAFYGAYDNKSVKDISGINDTNRSENISDDETDEFERQIQG